MRYLLATFTLFAVAHLQAQEYRHPSVTDPGYLGESNRFFFLISNVMFYADDLLSLSLFSCSYLSDLAPG